MINKSKKRMGGKRSQPPGVREGVRSRGVTRDARTDVGDQTIGRGVRERGTALRTGSAVPSTTAVRTGGNTQSSSIRGSNAARAESMVGRGEMRATTSSARGELRGGMSRSRSGAMSGGTGVEMGR